MNNIKLIVIILTISIITLIILISAIIHEYLKIPNVDAPQIVRYLDPKSKSTISFQKEILKEHRAKINGILNGYEVVHINIYDYELLRLNINNCVCNIAFYLKIKVPNEIIEFKIQNSQCKPEFIDHFYEIALEKVKKKEIISNYQFEFDQNFIVKIMVVAHFGKDPRKIFRWDHIK